MAATSHHALSVDVQHVNMFADPPAPSKGNIKTRTLSSIIDIEIPDFLSLPGCEHNVRYCFCGMST